MQQSEEGCQSFNLKEVITQFCRLIEANKVKKEINDLRIIYIKQEELPSQLIRKY